MCKKCSDKHTRRYETETEKGKARRRMLTARYQKAHPEKVRARNKRRWRRIKADPVLHAQVLEDARINRALRLEREGRKVKSKPQPRFSQPDKLPRVPVAPLLELIDELRGGGTEKEVARRLGVAPRTIYRWRHEMTEGLNVDTAERVLARVGKLWGEVFPSDGIDSVSDDADDA